jgi:photosystem II stability/assembly factor-like uncharacterized protein
MKPVTSWSPLAAGLAALATAGLAAGCATSTSTSGVSAGATLTSAAASGARSASPSGAAPTSRSAAPSGSASPAPSCQGATSVTDYRVPAGYLGEPSLQAIEFTDASHGWAAGNGRILATTDGGSNWTPQYVGRAALYQVDFIDAAHGWAVGQGALLRTTDGGLTWTPLAEPCKVIDTVHFVSPSTGFAVAGYSAGPALRGSLSGPYTGTVLLKTADGGATWQHVTGAPAQPQSACFSSASDGYLGTPGRIWRTTDGGSSWSPALTEPTATGGGGQPTAADTPMLECAGPSGAWVLFLGMGAAMEHAPYLAYASQDGREWHPVLEEAYIESAIRPGLKVPDGPGSYPGPFSAISPDEAAFVGYTPPMGWGAAGLDLATNRGLTLSNQGNVSAINAPLAVAFLSTTQGWVVGENLQTHAYLIEATSDGGHTWHTQYTVR